MNIDKNQILIAVIAGGLSKRFGGEIKTLTKINNKTIFEMILSNFKEQKIDIVVSSNSELPIFTKYKLKVIKDVNSGFQGPLAGIYASMLWSKKRKLSKKWIFTVPSDTPFLPNNLIEVFVNSAKKSSEILVARSNLKIHPLISMFSLSLFNSLEEELNSSNRKIMKWVEKHRFNYVDFHFNEFDPFFNINTKSDLTEAEKINSIYFNK